MSDSALPEIEKNAVVNPSNPVNVNLQVRLKSEGEKLLLILPTQTDATTDWSDLWQQLKQRLNGGDRFWQPHTTVHLVATDRLLDARQLQAIADALTEVQLQLTRVFTSRRQTAVAAATAGYSVEQTSVTKINQTSNATAIPLAEPLYLQMTVRSGMEIRHAGSVVVLGDVNPGGAVVANGDILVWGRLRGVTHAGAAGNSKCLIMALQMEPTQLRIAEFVARAPTNVPSQFYPEIAYVMPEGIRIAKAADFSKSQFSLPS
jgi:septum site-determining protein MinC